VTYKKITEIVKGLDDKSLYNYRHRGVPLWEIIKRRVVVKNFEKSDDIGDINHSGFDTKRLFSTLFYFFVSFYQLIFKVGLKEYLFIGFSRRVKVDGEYVDIYHDHLIKSLGEDKSVMFERPIKGAHMKPRKYLYGVIYLDCVCYLAEIFSRCLFLKTSSSDFKKLSDNLTSKGLEMPSLREVNIQINKFKIEAWFAKLLLAKVKPKSIVITSKWLHLPFIAAANKESIPVYEVQHGARFYYNLAYQGFGRFNKFRIDWLLTMGPKWNSLPWESTNVIDIGNSNFSGLEGLKVRKCNAWRSILFISQPELWKSIKLDVAELAKRNPEFQITLRFHPKDIGNVDSRYGSLRKHSNISFEFPDHNVSDSIARHSLIVGYTSTVIFQAHDMGAKVALVAGDAFTVDDYHEIFEDMIGSFEIIESYNLSDFDWGVRVQKGCFFSSFKPESWKKLVEGEAIDSN